MIIAFEGPDKVGKSTVARELSTTMWSALFRKSQIRSIALTGLIGSLIWSTG